AGGVYGYTGARGDLPGWHHRAQTGRWLLLRRRWAFTFAGLWWQSGSASHQPGHAAGGALVGGAAGAAVPGAPDRGGRLCRGGPGLCTGGAAGGGAALHPPLATEPPPRRRGAWPAPGPGA